MPIEPQDYHFLNSASSNGTFETNGYETAIIPVMPYSCLNISLWTSVASTLNIYIYPSPIATDRKLKVFEKKITANQTFFKRFAVAGMFFSIEVGNDNASQGTIELATGVSTSNQFASETLLNSDIGITADTSLVRVANNWNSDMVRGLHDDFTKVNIQAILNQSNPSTRRTLGLQDYEFNINSATALYLYHPNANDVSGGTGARSIRIVYVDSADTIQTLDFSLPGGAGLTAVGVNAKMVHRAFVLTAGSNNGNVGQLTLTDVGQTDIFSSIEAGENTSHNGTYLVPTNHELVISNIDIVGTGMSGILRIMERDYTNKILYSIGDFPIDSKAHNYSYNINGLIEAGRAVQIDYIPDAGTPSLQTIINVMVNGVLSPIKNSF